jgi:glycine cleavage system H protein
MRSPARASSLPGIPTHHPQLEECTVYPENLKYTSEHEWVRTPGDTEGSVRIGITDFAQDALGDIVYVSLPQVGDTVTAGDTCGELESTKSVSDVYAPVSGEVVARNDALDATPELVNNDPYGGGWLFEVVPSSGGQLDDLMDAITYEASLNA